MKYAEQPGVGVSVLVDASPTAMWELVSDVTVPPSFDNECVRTEWEDAPDGPALGATFRGYNRHPGLGWEWDVECRVTRFDEGREFGWRVTSDGGGAAEWWFTVEPVGDGGSRLWFHATMGPGFSGLSPAIEQMPDQEAQIVANRLGEWTTNMTTTIEGIKALAEAR
ncbi:MAG: SRPBCC family protein [Actinomycetota bacterium]